jgi:polar amino acid transport system substrate-binding protein
VTKVQNLLRNAFFGGLMLASSAAAASDLVEQGALSVGSDLTYPPFVYMDEGKPAGFDVDVMKAIAERMELEPKFIDTRFAALITGIRAGHFDIIASALYVTEERQRVLSFLPYTKAGSSILVLSSQETKPASIADLCGQSVSSIRGASWTPKLAEFATAECGGKTIEVREFDTDAQATQAMRAGAVSAQFLDNVVAAEVVGRQGGEFEVASSEVLFPVLVGLAVQPDKTELFASVARAFGEIRADGTFEKLREQYGMAAVTDEEIAEISGLDE